MKETPESRSRVMRAVRSRDTTPELAVRRFAHAMGYRFRLHRSDLPGTPDLVFPRLRKVIFVHGCFWHGHECARGARIPKRNRAYWVKKVSGNRARDKKTIAKLKEVGWRVLVVWECQLGDVAALKKVMGRFLN